MLKRVSEISQSIENGLPSRGQMSYPRAPSHLVHGMVASVKIKNFRGFQDLSVENLALINILVGDNGSGKTAFLEALYLAVSGSADKPFTLKQWRGQDITFQTGSVDSVVEAIYADLFHDPNSEEPISILLAGQGFENRQLVISKAAREVTVPTEPFRNRQAPIPSQSTTVPIALTWTDDAGNSFTVRPRLGTQGLVFEGTNEKIPNSYLFASQNPISMSDAAAQFSALRKRRELDKFRKVFLSVFSQISDIDLAESAGASVLVADVPWAKQLLPLPLLSGGTNRAAAILLAMSHREDGLVMIDEIENGIFHARQLQMSAALLAVAREYRTQLLMTTPTEEWIEHFFEACGNRADDVAFWRLERRKYGPFIRKFTLDEFRSGMASGEMR